MQATICAVLLLALSFSAGAQGQDFPPDLIATDPAEVDPEHYRVELETPSVRVLRASFGAREQGRLQSEPERLLVCLTSARLRLTPEDGSPRDFQCSAGEVQRLSASRFHCLENLTDQVIEFLSIEIKQEGS